VAAASIFNSACATVYGDQQGAVDVITGTSCLVQRWVQTGAGNCGCWYSSNTITSTGESIATYQNITQLSAYNCYCNGHSYTTVGWSPSASHPVGTPTTYTLSAFWGPFSASVQETEYPGTLSPYGPSGGQFGSTWNGSNDDYTYDSANSVSLVHTCVYCTGDAYDYVGIGWD
jgi:hypothetical protein